MKRIYYDSKHPAVADTEAMSLAEKLLTEDVIYTSNHLVILAVRLLIYRRQLNWEDVEVYYYDKGQTCKSTEYGRLLYNGTSEWNIDTDWLMEMM